MTQNSVERVDIHFINYSIQNSYLNVVLLFTLLFGVISGFLTSVFVDKSFKLQECEGFESTLLVSGLKTAATCSLFCLYCFGEVSGG